MDAANRRRVWPAAFLLALLSVMAAGSEKVFTGRALMIRTQAVGLASAGDKDAPRRAETEARPFSDFALATGVSGFFLAVGGLICWVISLMRRESGLQLITPGLLVCYVLAEMILV